MPEANQQNSCTEPHICNVTSKLFHDPTHATSCTTYKKWPAKPLWMWNRLHHQVKVWAADGRNPCQVHKNCIVGELHEMVNYFHQLSFLVGHIVSDIFLVKAFSMVPLGRALTWSTHVCRNISLICGSLRNQWVQSRKQYSLDSIGKCTAAHLWETIFGWRLRPPNTTRLVRRPAIYTATQP